MQLLCGDIGGTKTLLQRVTVENDGISVVAEQRFPSSEYHNFDEILRAFLAIGPQWNTIDAACFGVAGPVNQRDNGQFAAVTNLPWQIDSTELEERFGLPRVALINDFEAVGHGIDALPDSDFVTLQTGQPVNSGNQLVIGAGTGLGVAQRVWTGNEYQIIPTEGGHADFAPADELQLDITSCVIHKYGRCSVEFLVSGPGLINLFSCLAETLELADSDEYRELKQAADPAAAIAAAADERRSALACRTMDLFVTIYGGQAGNFTLACLPLGGVYIAGGIAAKISHRLQAGGFMEAFNAKGKMAQLMQRIPVKVITNQSVGLIGTRVYAQRLAER